MTENKKTVETYMHAYAAGNNETVLSCLTDDIVWEVPGYFNISGKDAFNKEINNENSAEPPHIRTTRMVEENDIVVAEGAVQNKLKNGSMIDMVFCDVFHMRNKKIKHLTSYLMNRQQQK